MALFIIAVIIFVIADIAIRYIIKHLQEKKIKKEREKVLEVSLNLDFSSEAKTLKRAEVKNPKAKILCVDDEPIILDSFRKILVLDGYNVDTVETGQEALGLIQKHSYDFLFTDLKMPTMDGVEVTKAVKHLRPDIDVIIITGFATVETAVEVMKYGAMDYVQKPFTEDELLDFTKKSLIKRQENIKKQLKPKVHISHLSGKEYFDSSEFAIPGGVFISKDHCWLSIASDGNAKIGIDDFAKKLIGKIDAIEFPNLGMQVKADQPLFGLKQGNRHITFHSPITGTITEINIDLEESLENMEISPYESNWICKVDADNLDIELKDLKIGNSAVEFYEHDIEHYQDDLKKLDILKNGDKEHLFHGELSTLDDFNFKEITEKFFQR